jgi:hypothetical protein
MPTGPRGSHPRCCGRDSWAGGPGDYPRPVTCPLHKLLHHDEEETGYSQQFVLLSLAPVHARYIHADRRPRRTLRTTSPCSHRSATGSMPIITLSGKFSRHRLLNLVYHKTRKTVHNSILCITGETQLRCLAKPAIIPPNPLRIPTIPTSARHQPDNPDMLPGSGPTRMIIFDWFKNEPCGTKSDQ